MNVTDIGLQGFTSHQNTVLKLPKYGLVVVSGHNGSGKSSVVEAVAWACWGETLRGTDPWTEGKACSAVATVTDAAGGGLVVARTRQGKRSLLDLTSADGRLVPGMFDTATKAQAVLAGYVGDFETWRRTSVFSSSDASSFTGASDGERKRLLEQMLGLDKFDTALDSCRADLKAAREKVLTLQGEQRVVQERERAALARCDYISANLSDVMANKPLSVAEANRAHDGAALAEDVAHTELADHRVVVERASATRASARTCYDNASRRDTQMQSNLRVANSDAARCELALRNVTQQLACPACARDYDTVARAASLQAAKLALDAAQAAQTAAKAAQQDSAADLADCLADYTDADIAYTKLRDRLPAISIALADAKRELMSAGLAVQAAVLGADRIATVQRELQAAKTAAAAATAEVAVCTGLLTKATSAVSQLATCEQVLGLRGVRAAVLAKALGGIESVANSWLQRIAGAGLTVKLKASTEKKSGGSVDAISLQIDGAGGGRGYKGASGGERRRIDIAFLFALAEVGRAARSSVAGTLWFDECMDNLDLEGIDAVALALKELSRDRAIVVITHSEHLAQGLRPDRHWRVAAGVVQ